MSKTYWACADGMSLAAQLAHATQLMPYEELQRRIGTMFDQMGRRFREVGIPEEDANECRYALSAFIDEQLFRLEWPGRQMWLNRPLQLVYFNENTAGEGFFDHVEQLRRQPQRTNVLQIYYLCMELGFQGKYAVHGPDGQRSAADAARVEVLRDLPRPDLISPHAEPPALRAFVSREKPIVAIAIGVLGLAVFIYIVLKLVLLLGTNDAITNISKSRPPTAATTSTKP